MKTLEMTDRIDASALGINLHTIADLATRLVEEAPNECQDLIWCIKQLALATAAQVDQMPGGLEWKPSAGSQSPPS